MDAVKCLEVLKSYVDNIEDGNGWWYSFPMPGKKDHCLITDMFPNANTLFGMHKDAMSIFWIEAGWLKKCGSTCKLHKNKSDEMKEHVTNRSSFEISPFRISGSSSSWHVKLGSTNKSLSEMWKRH